eukprot:SAG22_NODE_340_length_12031_cov_9.961783_5_plen_228_part_00
MCDASCVRHHDAILISPACTPGARRYRVWAAGTVTSCSLRDAEHAGPAHAAGTAVGRARGRCLRRQAASPAALDRHQHLALRRALRLPTGLILLGMGRRVELRAVRGAGGRSLPNRREHSNACPLPVSGVLWHLRAPRAVPAEHVGGGRAELLRVVRRGQRRRRRLVLPHHRRPVRLRVWSFMHGRDVRADQTAGRPAGSGRRGGARAVHGAGRPDRDAVPEQPVAG